DRDPGRIVAAIFEAMQPLHQDRRGVAFSDIANDAAHFWIPSTVDHASKLPFAVLGRAKPPALELRGKANKDLAVRQTLALQGAMAPRYELFRPLVEKRQHLFAEPGRLRTAQSSRAPQVGNEILELGRLRHRWNV